MPKAARARHRRDEFIPPQLATPVDALPPTGTWISELKLDGYRMLVYADRDHVRCMTRSALDWSHRVPELCEALRAAKLKDTWLDGELIGIDATGKSNFQVLQNQFEAKSEAAMSFVVFDMLRHDGQDLRQEPLRERRRLLGKALRLGRGKKRSRIRVGDFVDGADLEAYEKVCAAGFEGLILKDPEAPYVSGRTRSWLKLKCRHEQELVIIGYTQTAEGRDTFSSLLLGYYTDDGSLVFAGRAGSGFTQKSLTEMKARLDKIRQPESPCTTKADLRNKEKPVWVKPKYVAQVRFNGWTDSGIMRQPLFIALREDLKPQSIRRERTVKPPRIPAAVRGRARPRAPGASAD